MIATMTAKTAITRLLRSRLGLAAVTGILALVVIGAMSWQIRGIKIELRDKIIEAQQLERQNAEHQSSIDRLRASVQEQNRQIQALREAAARRSQSAAAAVEALAVTDEQIEAIKKSPADAQEMNRWLTDLFSQP